MCTSWIYLKGDSPSIHASCHQEASMPTINDRHVFRQQCQMQNQIYLSSSFRKKWSSVNSFPSEEYKRLTMNFHIFQGYIVLAREWGILISIFCWVEAGPRR